MSKAKNYLPGLGSSFKISTDEIDVKGLAEEINAMNGGSGAGITEEQVQAIVDASISSVESQLSGFYNKTASDGRFQPKGAYALSTSTYTKSESDTKFQLKGSYALSDASYNKSESDTKYQPKGSYASSATTYTKTEVDALINALREELKPSP